MFLACGIVFLAESECRNRTFISIVRRWLRLPPPEGILLALFLAVFILWGGGKANTQQAAATQPGQEQYFDGVFCFGRNWTNA